MSFGIFVKTKIPELCGDPIIYEALDAAEKFMATLKKIAHDIEAIYKRNNLMTELIKNQVDNLNDNGLETV